MRTFQSPASLRVVSRVNRALNHEVAGNLAVR